VAIVVSLFLLRQGQAYRRELRREQRGQQASRVTIWCEWNLDSPDADYDRPAIPAVFVSNASEQAVYEVFVDYLDPVEGVPVRIDVGPVPPGATRHRDVLASIPAEKRWEPSSLMPRLFFRDAEGQYWMRDSIGRLRRDPGPGNDGFAEDGGRFALGLPRPKAPNPHEDRPN
jgi:hypothetical protein